MEKVRIDSCVPERHFWFKIEVLQYRNSVLKINLIKSRIILLELHCSQNPDPTLALDLHFLCPENVKGWGIPRFLFQSPGSGMTWSQLREEILWGLEGWLPLQRSASIVVMYQNSSHHTLIFQSLNWILKAELFVRWKAACLAQIAKAFSQAHSRASHRRNRAGTWDSWDWFGFGLGCLTRKEHRASPCRALYPDGSGIAEDKQLMMDWSVKHPGRSSDSVQMLPCKAME